MEPEIHLPMEPEIHLPMEPEIHRGQVADFTGLRTSKKPESLRRPAFGCPVVVRPRGC